jgi:N-terminal of TM subunit in PBP-dependent ABC transporters
VAQTQPPGRRARPGSTTTTTTGLVVKIVLLGLVLAVAVFAAFPLVEQGQWLGLALVVGVTALLFWIYLSPRRIPAKYLIPGTLFLLAFQVFPVLYTMSTAFTNFGDAHRGSKVEGSTDYRLAIATTGDPATGDIVFRLKAEVSLVEALGAQIVVHFELNAPRVVTEDTKLLDKDAHTDEAPAHAEVRGTRFVASFAPRSRVKAGDQVEVVVDTERMHFFDPETGAAIRD